MMPHGYMYGDGVNVAWGWVMVIGMALFWILFLTGLALLIRWAWGHGIPGGTPLTGVTVRASALDILQERYARGEITTEQYREMKNELGSGGTAPA